MTVHFQEMPAQQQKEIRMYGCTVEQMREAIDESLTYRFSGAAMYVISMLSDAQHMLAYDLGKETEVFMALEDQRQLLNRAKWVLSTYCMNRETV